MYLWIFLFVLGFAVALYFAWQNRGLSDDEIVISPPTRRPRTADLEVADELEPQDGMEMTTDDSEEELRQDQNHEDLEVAEELDFDVAVRNIHAQQGVTPDEPEKDWVKEPLDIRREKELVDLNFRKIPIPRNAANDTTLDMEMAELGIDDTTEPIAKETKTVAEDLFTDDIRNFIRKGQEEMDDSQAIIRRDDQEVAEELEPTFNSSQAPLRVILDPKSPADHVIHIGEQPERISGYDMTIDMELSPRFIALNKDPYWTYLYWILPKEVPEGQWELKVKNLSEGKEYFQGVNPEAGRWYIHLNQPEQRFNFELGVWSQRGHFQTILTSNEVQAPPHQPSDQVDADWATIEELYQGKFVTIRGRAGQFPGQLGQGTGQGQTLQRAGGSPEFIMGRAEGSPEFVMSRAQENQH